MSELTSASVKGRHPYPIIFRSETQMVSLNSVYDGGKIFTIRIDDCQFLDEWKEITINRRELDDKIAEHLNEIRGSIWDNHHEFLPTDWITEVVNNETRLGYWEWVENQIEIKEADNAESSNGKNPA